MSNCEPFIHSKGKPKCRWNPSEDQLLLKSIAEFGTHNWKIIATKVPGRTSKQCRERWVGKLSPDVITGDWTEKEDNILTTLHKELGNQWAKISKHLNGRSMIAVKNRWCCLKRKCLHEKPEIPSAPVMPKETVKTIEKPKANEECESIFEFTDQALKDLDLLLNNEHFMFDFSEPM